MILLVYIIRGKIKMSQYCTLDDLKNILPKNIIIGKNVQSANVNCTEDRALFFIEQTAGTIDANLSSLYRIPLIKYKEPQYDQDPITFIEEFPPPIVLINARLAAASIYDYIMSANQEPNVSEFGKNQRSLAYDDLSLIQAGVIQLKNQYKTGTRFVRQELMDSPRVILKNGVQTPQRQAGQ
jgi:hypothetical protein